MLCSGAGTTIALTLGAMDSSSSYSELVVDHTTIALLVVDERQRLHFLNSAAEMLLGVSAKKAVGLLLTEIVDIRCEMAEGLQRIMETNHPYTEREVELRLPGGEKIIVDCTLSPLLWQQQGQRTVVELQRMDQQLRLMNEEHLLNQTQASADLLRGLAHEIKNPLGGLRGAAQLLESELNDRSLREYTEVIIGEADRLQLLLDRMLGPNRPPQLRETNIHELLERVRTLVMVEAGDAPLQIQRDYDPSIPDLVADGNLLIQALLNIVRNAAQSLKNSGEIRLRTRIRRQVTIGHNHHRLVCSLEIEDNGPGISEELQKSIFLPMVTGRAEGTGLGLSIAQSIIHRHGGVIECQSNPEKTIFTLLIPLEE
mgnify:CR=1 FL=1